MILFEAPLISFWIDMLIICILFSVINKAIQHLTMNPKRYFEIRRKNKELNKDMKRLAKENKFDEMKVKQNEAFKLVGEQFKLSRNSMLVMIVVAFPTLYFVKYYYNKFVYDFLLFKVSGLWAYVIIGFILAIVVSSMYDKFFEKYYVSGVETSNIKK